MMVVNARYLVRAAAVGLCGLLLLSQAVAQESPPNQPPFDHITGGNVVPPGNRGHIPSTALAQALAGTYEDPRMTEQRDLYVAFDRKEWSLAAAGTTVAGDGELGEGYSPRAGVVIYRDDYGVPRIFGETDADAQFGAGYAVAEDRLFQADIFRRVARGEMAEFVGGQTWYDYDRAWRAEFYTDEELLAMADRFYTPDQLALMQAYADGINAYIEEAMRDPDKLPAEYVALGVRPEPWDVTHSLSVAVLQSRDSVEGFGQELFNAELLRDLVGRLGAKEGRRAFTDIRFYRDPGAYSTAPRASGVFRYPGGGFDGLDAPGVVLPDPDTAEDAVDHDDVLRTALRTVGLARREASNAIAVGSKLADKGDPILLGGPQLDYLVPSIFYEIEIHSPNQHARGVAFPGTVGLVLIGKSPTHAWSITYGYTDQVDVFLVPLDPKDETHYLRNGESKPLETYTTTVTCKADQTGFATSPSAADTCDGAPAATTQVEVRRVPEYGPVFADVTVGGKPYVAVKVRAHWMREPQNALPFLTFNQPTTMKKFRAAQKDFNISLNVNYVDHRGNAGFWHVARPPIRAAGTDVRLPVLGNGKYDWKGFLPLERIPHAINPRQGYTANWNNQIAAGWHNGDQNYWAAFHRVQMLSRRMAKLARRGDITPDDVWRVNREASYEDARWLNYMRHVRRAFAGNTVDGDVGKALDLVMRWNGQRTATQDDDGVFRYDSAAVGIFDAFVTNLQQAVMADELGERFYPAMGADLDVDFYAFKPVFLNRVLQGAKGSLPTRHDWVDGPGVNAAIRTAFEKAVAELGESLGGSPDTWRVPAVLTRYRAVGLGRVKPHPFMNRGTYNELAVARTR